MDRNAKGDKGAGACFFLFFFSKMFHEQVHLEEGSGMKRVIKALEHVFFFPQESLIHRCSRKKER